MTASEVELYNQETILGSQYDVMLEKYGALGVSRTEYIEQARDMNDIELASYNSALMQSAAIETLGARYDEAAAAAYKSLSGQFELWDTVDDKVNITKKTLIKAQEQQQKYWKSLSSNIDNLSSRGIKGMDQLLSSIDVTTQEGAAAVAAFASMTDSELRDYIANMGDVEGAMEGASKKIGRFSVDAGDSVGGFSKTAQTESDKYATSMDDVAKTTEKTSSAISSELDSAEKDVQTFTRNVKKYVSALNTTMPEIKFKVNQNIDLPHFSMTGSFDAQSGRTPKVSVRWYDQGGIFDTPQIIGVAERRSEFVGASQDLKSFINDSVNEAFANINPVLFRNIDTERDGNTYINVTAPIQVTRSLSESDIRSQSRAIVSIVGREFAQATGGKIV